MTSKDAQTCLSAEMLRQLSHDELTPKEVLDIEEHVTGCDRCRKLLDAAETNSRWQEELRPILRTPSESLRVPVDADDDSGCDSLSRDPVLTGYHTAETDSGTRAS